MYGVLNKYSQYKYGIYLFHKYYISNTSKLISHFYKKFIDKRQMIFIICLNNSRRERCNETFNTSN